jgi:hypothetical protein
MLQSPDLKPCRKRSWRQATDLKQVNPAELLGLLQGLRRHTGWSPMYVFTRAELEPYPVEANIIECWLGRSEPRDAAHADFWRVSTDGNVVLVRGHQEDGPEFTDGGNGLAAGTAFEVTLPAWRIAEFLLRVSELGEKLSNGPFRLQLIAEWEGLEGRKLFSHRGRRHFPTDYTAHDGNYRTEIELGSDEIGAALPAITARIVAPLLRKFSFFEPPQEFFEEELRKMRGREFG